MTSTSEQQEPHPPHCTCGSLGADGSNNVDAETPASAQQEDQHDDLVGLTAKLDLEDQDPEPDMTSKSNIDTWSDEDAPSKAMYENADPGLATATAAAPMSAAQVDQSEATENVKDAANGTVPKTAHAGSEQGDETDTPRFSTYVKLHNEMMTAKTALASNNTEQIDFYHRASHVARTLLTSHEKHSDLPLVMHAHACLVLGCSDEDDCYERMQEALVLIAHAMEEGAVSKPEGEMMIKTCEVVMGMREQAPAASDDEDSNGDVSDEDGEDGGMSDGQGESNKHDMGKDEHAVENGDEGYGKNAALP